MKKEIKLNLSKEMKIILAVGGVLLVAVFGFVMTSKPKPAAATSAVTPPPTPAAPSVGALAAAGSKSKPSSTAAADLLPGLPAAVRTALTAHGVVVAIVYGAGDKDAVTAAREGAHTAHAGFAALDVAKESVAQAVELFAPATSDPTVLVVRRPGTVTTVLPGYSDSDTVAQAAAQPDTTATSTAAATTTPAAAAPAPAPAATPAP